MKYLTILFLSIRVACQGQLTMETAQAASLQYHVSSYSYLEQFNGHKGYGASLILTADGGAAAFGDGDEISGLMKFDKDGKVQWKKAVPKKGDEQELQGVVQTSTGSYMGFMLVYGAGTYRGGCERAVYFTKTGAILWDKYIGSCNLINSPTVSYMKALPDGRVSLRGHIVKTKPEEGKDPTYLFWEGWLNSKGVLTQKTGPVIDWSKKEEWEGRLKPEEEK